MRTASLPFLMVLAALALVSAPARAQVVYLQNDSYGGGALNCYTGVGDQESIAAKFTASAGQYPYVIDRVRIFGCGGGLNPYNVFIFQDDGTGVNPGALIWQSANSYILVGSNAFNDILMSSEPVPPPSITSGTIRVELYTVFAPDPIGFGTDLGGIVAQRNFLRSVSGVWSFAESQGVSGDWIFRLGILAPSATPSLSILDVSLPEGNSGTNQATFTVTLSPAGTMPVTVDYATADGTATAPSDYLAASGTLTFDVGQTVKTLPVTFNGDVADEQDEVFTVTLSNPQNALIDRGTGEGTLTDDDPTPGLSVGDVTVTEGQTGTVNAVFNVTMTGLSGQTVTAPYSTAAGTATAGTDYATTSGTLTFAPSETTRSVTVTVNGDLADEPNETFFLDLGTPTNASVLDGRGLGTITDDDGLRYYAVTPCRVIDTRTSTPLTAGGDRTVTVAGVCGVPATAKAVALILTVAQPTDPGFIRLYPAGETAPTTSAINYVTGKARANNGIFGLGNGGAIVAHCGQASGTTHLILDVFGYFQ